MHTGHFCFHCRSLQRVCMMVKRLAEETDRSSLKADASNKPNNHGMRIANPPAAVKQPAKPLSSVSRAFFSGKIKDCTTDSSHKAVQKLAILWVKNRNPAWTPLNSKACCRHLGFFGVGV